MSDVFEAQVERPGTRLHRLELFNWGTFDSSDGSVFVAKPSGRTTLLVGRNGAGKSTLVDAILTLLVPNNIRNYNVAAGASKKERTERTYVLGACDQQIGDSDGSVSKRYLRGGGKHYTVLLAYFCDEHEQRGFTIAQVLYAKADGNIEKIFLFSEGDRSVQSDLQGLTKSEGLISTLKSRGFQATRTFSEYHGWFVRRAGLKPLAMDMFNQTVAVKDIRSLNQFIRAHMLEPSAGRERVQKLIQHFGELRAAHRQLVRVRTQYDLLLPIERFGNQYSVFSSQLKSTQQLVSAADPFFRQATVDLARPELENQQERRKQLVADRDQLKRQISEASDQARTLKNEIDQAGGERLRQLPMLIELEQTRLEQKKTRQQHLVDALQACGRQDPFDSPDQLTGLFESLKIRQQEIHDLTTDLQNQRDEIIVQRAGLVQRRDQLTRERALLGNRRTNIPTPLANLRTKICETLALREDQLLFACELMAVRDDQSAWEMVIESVLKPISLSMLVPDKHYRRVSKFIEQYPIKDQNTGVGQQIRCLRVANESPNSGHGDRLHDQSLVRKMEFREGHNFVPWLRQQLESRYDFRCCDTLTDFDDAPRLALTKNRIVKFGGSRLEKDDRPESIDPSQYVLGWTNQIKRDRVTDSITEIERQIDSTHSRILDCESRHATLNRERSAIERCFHIKSFAEIDTSIHEDAIRSLIAERQALESDNDRVKVLKDRLAQIENSIESHSTKRDQTVEKIGTLSREIESLKRVLANSEEKLLAMKANGRYERARATFDQISAILGDQTLNFHELGAREERFREAQQNTIADVRRSLEPIESKLTKAMGDFFKKCQEERDDLDASLQSLPSFLAKLDAIRREDLPRHETRFKQRLNDTVTKEIGVFHSELQAEGRQIQRKIDELNEALKELPYNEGTHMRLDIRPVKNAEISDFRNTLRSCLEDNAGDSQSSREQRFKRIEGLISRLSEESTWRDRVIDVRRWYDFGACEIDAETGDTRSYYEDSSGQSGGEKARLAFTILVAAIVYQYDLDLSGADQSGFHFVVVDEMFSKIDDRFAEYALKLFERFGLQLIIVAPLDAKARVTEAYVQYYLQILKDEKSYRSRLITMTAREYEQIIKQTSQAKRPSKKRPAEISDAPLLFE